MAGLSLNQLEPRSARRIRLLFSKNLAVAAFTSTTYYTVTCLDGAGASPPVVAALAVPNTPFAVELALGVDLVPGGAYTVSAVAVPALDASTTPPGSELPLRQAERPISPTAEITPDTLAAFFYGADIAFQGDFLETADGDLARISGIENVKAALSRTMISDGLIHDPTYGAAPREYVDGPATALGTLPGKEKRALLRDDRVKRVRSVSIADRDPNDTAKAVINAEVDLIGGSNVATNATLRTS